MKMVLEISKKNEEIKNEQLKIESENEISKKVK